MLLTIERISKRINTRQRNRIQKKVAEHHRKARKLEKQSTQWKSKKPKDLGIPNSFPFKEQMLAEQEEARRRREEERQEKKKRVTTEGLQNGNGENGLVKGIVVDSDEGEFKDEVHEPGIESEEEEEEDDDDDMDDDEDEDGDGDEDNDEVEEDEDDDLMDDIESSESEWDGIESDQEISDLDMLTETNTNRNAKKPGYVKAILRSNLIIFVLDARCPDLTRSIELENFALKKGKECMYVLNQSGIRSKWDNLT